MATHEWNFGKRSARTIVTKRESVLRAQAPQLPRYFSWARRIRIEYPCSDCSNIARKKNTVLYLRQSRHSETRFKQIDLANQPADRLVRKNARVRETIELPSFGIERNDTQGALDLIHPSGKFGVFADA